MIGALHKRNSCIALLPPGSHYSRIMSKPTTPAEPHKNPAMVSVKRCHSSSKVEQAPPSAVVLKERINSDLKIVAQNLCMIESMIPCMRNDEDSQELIKQLRETNRRLQQILPALHVFMTLPSPVSKEEKERYNYERKQLTREFEAAIKSYKGAHKTLNTAVKRLKKDAVVL